MTSKKGKGTYHKVSASKSRKKKSSETKTVRKSSIVSNQELNNLKEIFIELDLLHRQFLQNALEKKNYESVVLAGSIGKSLTVLLAAASQLIKMAKQNDPKLLWSVYKYLKDAEFYEKEHQSHHPDIIIPKEYRIIKQRLYDAFKSINKKLKIVPTIINQYKTSYGDSIFKQLFTIIDDNEEYALLQYKDSKSGKKIRVESPFDIYVLTHSPPE